MLEDVRLANNNISKDDARIKSSSFVNHNPSFKGNPNAVDSTPKSDTYQGQQLPPEIGFGEKFMRYIIPTWMGLHFGTELFNKANSGEYEKSLVGRLGRLGDRISETAIVNNRFVDWAKQKSSSAKTRFKAFVERHPMLDAMHKTPTEPECPLVTNFLETQTEADIKEAAGKLTKYTENNPKTLKLAGATKAEIDALKTKYGTGAFGRINNERGAVQEFLLSKLGTNAGNPNIMATIEAREAAMASQLQRYEQLLAQPNLTPQAEEWIKTRMNRIAELRSNYRANTLKTLKLKDMGMTSAEISDAVKNPAGYGAKIERALESATKYSPKMSQYYNKIRSISAPVSKLGRFLPKAAKLGMRGLTFGGGLFNSLFVAFFLADAVKNTIDAPKEQKAGTFASGLVEAMSWVIAMPLALKGMHAVNGLKNLGKTKAQNDAYKNALKVFNEKVKTGKLTDPALYQTEFNNLKALKNAGVPQKGLKKVISKVAQFLSIGLEQPARYKEFTKGLPLSQKIKPVLRNLKRNLPNIGKNVVGYPLRFALYAAIFAPVVDKAFSLVTHAIFGKPFEPEKLKEEQEKAQKEAELEAMKRQWIYPGPTIVPNPNAVNGLDKLDVNALNDDNLVKQELIKQGKATPNGKKSNTSTANNGYTNSVNGVQIDIKQGNQPFMPPEGANGVNGANPYKQNEKDPNKSDYDTIPRTYTPQIDKSNPIPYHDPYDTPGYEHNYENLQKSLEKSNKIINETEKWIQDGYPD